MDNEFFKLDVVCAAFAFSFGCLTTRFYQVVLGRCSIWRPLLVGAALGFALLLKDRPYGFIVSEHYWRIAFGAVGAFLGWLVMNAFENFGVGAEKCKNVK